MNQPHDDALTKGRRRWHQRSRGLAGRLMAAQLVVVLAGALAMCLVALAVGPQLFTLHLDHAGDRNPMVRAHAEEAFGYALAISLSVATLVSVLTALAVSGFVVRRLATPVTQLATAADQLATGNYRAHLPDPRLGSEFDRLTAAFTRMADRLATSETIRQRLLSDLAHELRTPVGTLTAHVDGIEDGVLTASPEIWQVMRDQLDRIQRLATDLTQLSAAEEHALALEIRSADLSQIASAATQAASPRYQAKGVGLTLVAPGPVPIQADDVRMQQVLANLLANALRHTPPGQGVTVTARRQDKAGVLEVADTGIGIPAGELDAVFERFHRVDPARSRADGGSGLGLTIARAIVADHGGTLTADSDGPGLGARFTLRIPLAAATFAGSPAAQRSEE